MDISSGEISSMVFRRVVRDDIGEFSLDSQMLSILMELDGTKNLGKIAQKTGFGLSTTQSIIMRLLQLQLIEPEENAVTTLDNDFFRYLTNQLSLAIGPVAAIFIEDAISDMGYNLSYFPSHQAADLVEILSREIQREEKRNLFKINMINKIKERGF